MKGQLIAIEGIDGVGCGTQARLLAERLDDAVLYTYPDYDHPTGEVLERFLHDEFDLTTEEQFLIYCANMIGDQDDIQTALEDGRPVICDRYFTSTLAYQSVNGMDMATMLAFAEQFSFIRPDLAIYLHSSTKTAHKRKIGEKDNLDRYEEDTDNQQRVAQAYQGLVEDGVFAERWKTVDAEPSIENVRSSVQDAVAEVL